MEQLKLLGKELGIPVFDGNGINKPVEICKGAVSDVSINGFRSMIIDTAGRLHVDDELMGELKTIKNEVRPHEILL